jgi:hypothetical protein
MISYNITSTQKQFIRDEMIAMFPGSNIPQKEKGKVVEIARSPYRHKDSKKIPKIPLWQSSFC